jgi:hypothetical protein
VKNDSAAVWVDLFQKRQQNFKRSEVRKGKAKMQDNEKKNLNKKYH